MKFFRTQKLRCFVVRIILCSIGLNIVLPVACHAIEASQHAAILLGAAHTLEINRAPRQQEEAGLSTVPFASEEGSSVCCPLPRDIFIHGDLVVGGSATIVGPVIFPGGTVAVRQLKLLEDPLNGTNSITFQAPESVPADVVLTFPATAGSVDQILTTDGLGNLSWTTLSVPGGVIFNGGNSFGAPITIGTNDNFALNLETFGTNRLVISNTGLVTLSSLAAAGVIHTDNTGLLSTSLIVNNDISNAAAISDTKLATISTAGKVANSATTATSANTANAIVSRDASGNFAAGTITANLTGAASNNVLKTGDTMTGNLVMANQSQVQLQELSVNGTDTVGLKAPASLAASYTLTLPTSTGSSNQVLTTDGTGTLSWQAVGGAGLTAIVNGGNSFGAAITIGTNDNFGLNFETNGTNRVQISNAGTVTINNLLGTGDRYVQASSTGDLSAIIPTGVENVIQVIQNSPTVIGKYYSDIKSAVDWANANAAVSTAIIVEAGTYSVGQTITVTNANIRSIYGSFATRIVPTAGLAGSPVFVLAQTGGIEPIEMQELIIDGQGVAGWSSTPGSIGIQITGSGQFSINRVVVFFGYQGIVASGILSPLQQVINLSESGIGFNGDCAVLVDNGANVNILNTILVSPGTQLLRAQHTNILAPTTKVTVRGGRSSNDPFGTGTAILAKDTAEVTVAGGIYRTLQNIFTVQDSAILQTVGNIYVNGSVTNYKQITGTARLTASGDLVYNATDSSKYLITNSANVLFNIIDASNGTSMTGRFTDSDTRIITFLNGYGVDNPSFNYENDWFGWRGDVLNFPQSSLVGSAGGMRTLSTENMDASLMSLVRGTSAHSDNTLLHLATYESAGDPSSPDLSLLRDWQLTKEAITHNYVMNYWNGATTTKYLTLTPLGRLGLSTSTPATTLEIGTGQLAVPVGTAANPSYTFSGDLDTGIYRPSLDTLGFSTGGIARASINSAGVVNIVNLASSGVVHSDNSGNLSTSLIVNNDIATGTITDSKLATITTAGKVANSATTATSANTANAIVARDASGNFSAGTITANVTGNITGNLVGNVTGAASLNVLKAGDTMTGSLVLSGGSTNLTVGGTTDVQALLVHANLHAFSSTTFDQGVPGVQMNILQVTTGALSGPNQFNSIKAAVDSITTNSASNPFIVNVGPGVYVEDTITLKPYVALVGESAIQTIIEIDATSKDIIVGSPDSVIDGFLLRGATDTGKAAVVYSGGFGNNNFIVRNCTFGSNDIFVKQTATVAPYSFLTVNNCTIDAFSQFTTGISASNSGPLVSALFVDGFVSSPIANAIFASGISISGAFSYAILRNVSIIGSQLAPLPGAALMVQDGANVTLGGSDVVGIQRGIYVPNVGAGPFISISSVLGFFNTEDVRIDNPFTTGSLDGTFDRDKVFIDSSAAVSTFFLDPVNQGTVTIGPLFQGNAAGEVTNISPQIQQTSTLGVLTGGEISDAGSLDVTAQAGTGYLMVGTAPNDYLQYTEWGTQTITLLANADSYIYIDNAGILQSALGQPNIITTISLGKVRTETSSITFIQHQPQDGTHLATDLEETLRHGLGPIYNSGSIVSKNGTLQLDVSSGNYFFGSLNYMPLGGTAISWDAFYQNGSGNLNVINNQNLVDYQQYDDGSGTLAPIPANEFARHAFYITNGALDEKYLLVYGQVVYPTLIDAQNGTIPPEPGTWNGNIALIASIIVENTAVAADRIAEIRDERPRLGFKASGVSVVTNHGDLTGLLDDDHPQYLLDNGTRPLSGNLNLATNNIVNVALINGIDITNNASRYLPNGADPLATGVPVSIGLANSMGVANAFSRSDHVHNHDNQPGGSLHAVATTSTAGFMSAADKTLLDSIDPSLYVLKTGSTMTGALNINTAGTAFAISTNKFTVNGTTGDTAIAGVLTLSPLTTGVLHSNGSGVVSSSLIVNADVDPAAAIVDTKLATISTAGKVANSATTATSANTASAIVARDGSGTFNAGGITLENQGQLQLQELTVNGTNTIALQAPDALSSGYTFTLPDSSGTSGYVLTTDGTGVTSWTAPTALPGFVLLGGNTNGAAMTIGTNDDFAFNLETNGTTRIAIANDGPVTISNLASTGVVHTNVSGLLSTSLIVNADVSPIAAIADTKLATISTAGKVSNSATTATSVNTSNAIVARDASGDFSAGIITASLLGNVTGSLTGAASLNVLKAGDTMTGNLIMDNQKQIRLRELTANGVNFAALQAPASLTADYTLTLPVDAGSNNQVLTTNGSGVLSWQTVPSTATSIVQGGNSFGTAMIIGELDNFGVNIITNSINRLQISNAGMVTVNGLNSAGVVHTDSSGNLSTSLIVNADVDPAAAIVDTKLATISTAGKVANSATTATSANTASAIVARDALGNFSAGTITASLTGAASLNVLKSGDTMTGSLQLPAGTAALPSLNFTGSTTTGLSAATADTLVLSTAGTNRIQISDTGFVTISNLNASGVVHTNNVGLLTTSLIVNSDIDSNAGINDTKLATLVTAGKVANSATTAVSTNTPNAIVLRDGLGNFSAGTITASLNGNATTATSAGSFSGSLSGDVTGTQSATVVAFVGGQSAASVASATVLANAATSTNSANAIVRRDGAGNFAASTITGETGLIAANGNITASSGNIIAIATGANANASSVDLIKNRTGGVITSGDTLGNITFQGFDGTGNIVGSKIVSVSSGTIATNRIPSDLEFFTHPNSTTTSTQRMVINSAGNVTINAPDSGVGLTISGGGLTSTGTTTLSSLGIGVVQASSSGVLSSSAGANGQLLIGAGVGAAPVWANLTSTGGTVSITNGAGTINLETSGATANSFVTGSGTATPSSGILSVPNGSNINTTGAGNTLTINLVNSPSVSGSLSAGTTVTAGTGITATTGNITASSGNIITSSGALQATAATNSTGLSVVGNGSANAATITAGSNAGGGLLITGGAGSGIPLQVTAAAGTGNAATFTGNATSPTISITSNAAQNSIIASSGTATVPAYSFIGSTSTGLYSPAANQVALTTNGTSRLSIGSTGIVTIPNLSSTGVVHNSAAGVLSTSLIVNADIDPAAAIVDTKLATISTAGKVANSATTATSANTASAIVARDASGNFSAGTITANLSGNATTATTTTNFSGSLSGDVTGTQGATVVATVGGQSAANVAAATVLANAATSANTASAIVRRDASGNFSAGTITASLTGAASLNVLKAGDTMTGTLQHPAGTAAAPSITFTGSTTTGFSAAVADTLVISTAGVNRLSVGSTGIVTIPNLSSTGVVHNSAAGVLSTSLIVNADVDPAAAIVDTKLATISTAGKVANSATTATSANTANAIVARDGSGNFSAGTITANLSGNATTATTATNFSGSLSGDVTGTQGATVVATVGGQSAANVAAATVLANAATSANTASAIVRRDASGNFSAGTITANLTGNVTGAASLNVLKAGDTMTGTLQLPAGTAAAPSLVFTGSTTTGISVPSSDTLTLSTAGAARLTISSTGNTTYTSNYKTNVYVGANQTISGAGTQTIQFNTESFDPNNNFNTGTFLYTAPATGYYLVAVNVSATYSNNNQRNIQLLRNGATVTGYSVQTSGGNGQSIATCFTTLVSLTAGDTLGAQMVNAGGNVVMLANQTSMAIHFMSI